MARGPPGASPRHPPGISEQDPESDRALPSSGGPTIIDVPCRSYKRSKCRLAFATGACTVRGTMSPLLFRHGVLAALALALGGCSTTKPLPKFERPLPHTQHQTVRTTAYTHSESDHVRYGRSSALGSTLRSEGIRSAAADWARWPAGTLFRIQETGEMYEVDDYGWALAGTNTIDLYKPTRASMNNWGVRRVHIEIQRWGDQRRSLAVLSGRTKYAHVRRMVSEIRSDNQPFQPLTSPTLTPPTDTIPPAMLAETAAPRAELVAARTGPPPGVNSGGFSSVRKPFRP